MLPDRHRREADRSRGPPTLKTVKRIVHISDLHLGRSRRTDDRAAQLALELLNPSIDCVVATGNLTHHGRRAELRLFEDLFAPLIRDKRLVAVPGDRDRLGDDLGWAIMAGPRVQVVSRPGLYVVRVNSTAARPGAAPGVQAGDLHAIDAALDGAPADAVTVVALHHELVADAPRTNFGWLPRWNGAGISTTVEHDAALLARLDGRCDLVLHGRGREPRGARVGTGARPLSVFSAGSSTELGHVHVFSHDAAGSLRGGAMWLDLRGLGTLGGSTAPVVPGRSAPSLMVA